MWKQHRGCEGDQDFGKKTGYEAQALAEQNGSGHEMQVALAVSTYLPWPDVDAGGILVAPCRAGQQAGVDG